MCDVLVLFVCVLVVVSFCVLCLSIGGCLFVWCLLCACMHVLDVVCVCAHLLLCFFFVLCLST